MGKIPIEELLNLPVSERIQLVEDLWDSIAAEQDQIPVTNAQREEVRRRTEEHDADPASAGPWAEVRERLLDKYG